MADVFISYSSKDRDRARTLAIALADLGWSVWWDREILTGQAFDHAIERELDCAKCVVVLWSQASVESEWVKNEAASAAERGILLPGKVDGTRPPLEFRRKQTADLTDWSGHPAHDGFQALCQAINSIVGGVSLPPKPTPTGHAMPNRRIAFGAIAVVVVVIVAGLYINLPGKTDPPKQATSGQTQITVPSEQRTPDSPTLDLADAVIGTYVGEIIADSKGSSRSNVVVVVNRLGLNAVRVSSSYSRMGTFDVELTQIDKKVLNAGGDTPFIVDLAATPPTLSLDPHSELAYRGTLKRF
jgi:hypothetical protein